MVELESLFFYMKKGIDFTNTCRERHTHNHNVDICFDELLHKQLIVETSAAATLS